VTFHTHALKTRCLIQTITTTNTAITTTTTTNRHCDHYRQTHHHLHHNPIPYVHADALERLHGACPAAKKKTHVINRKAVHKHSHPPPNVLSCRDVHHPHAPNSSHVWQQQQQQQQ
jgi:hypothetical protein